MLFSIMVILLCQLIGEFITQFFLLPIPGSVMGMVILMIVLALRERFKPLNPNVSQYDLEKTGLSLLKLLPLLFIPATVGVMNKGAELKEYGMIIVTAVILSTLLTLALSTWLFSFLVKRFHVEEDKVG